MFEFLGGEQSVWLFFAVFIIFTIIAYKLVKFVFKTFMIGLVAALFPVFANLFFGWGIPINLSSMLWFAFTGMGFFILYTIARLGVKGIKVAVSPLKLLKRKKKEESPSE